MSPIQVKDLDKTEAWKGGAMLPPGQHVVRIESADDSTPSSGGHDQVEMEFQAQDGSGSIRDWLVFTPKTLGKARSLLDAVGIVPESGEWVFPTDALTGKTLTITVAQEPDRQGATNDDGTPKMRSRVVAYTAASAASTPASGNGATKSDDDIPF